MPFYNVRQIEFMSFYCMILKKVTMKATSGFSETRDSKTACDYVRQLYRNGRIYAKEGVLVRRK